MATISVRVTDVLAGELENVAKETERPKSFIIQKAIEAYLADYADLQIALDRLREGPVRPTHRGPHTVGVPVQPQQQVVGLAAEDGDQPDVAHHKIELIAVGHQQSPAVEQFV